MTESIKPEQAAVTAMFNKHLESQFFTSNFFFVHAAQRDDPH